MLRVVAVLVVIALYISFVVDVIRTPSPTVRALQKWGWLLVVIVFPILGGVLWWVFGRPRRTSGLGWRRRQPLAPDDDPKFLKQLDEQAWREKMRRRRGESPPSEA